MLNMEPKSTPLTTLPVEQFTPINWKPSTPSGGVQHAEAHMSVRTTMQEIIAQVRQMVDDVADGSTQQLTDLTIQDRLDDSCTRVRYMPLEPLEVLVSGGTATYLEYITMGNFYPWEQDAVIYNGVYTVITPASVDWKRGVWTLSTSILPPVLVTGKVYDVNLAAAQVLEEWAAKLTRRFDFSADDQKFARSQMHEMLLRQAGRFRRRARPQRAILHRSDT